MKKIFLTAILFLNAIAIIAQSTKAPAYPLITHNPYFSIWSTTDELTASPTKHWTGADHMLIGMLKVDNTVYRFLGNTGKVYKTIVPASDETNYQVSYTESTPGEDWMKTSFDDSSWRKGMAPFGDNKSVSKTMWLTKDLWIRRSVNINDLDLNNLFLKLQHDDNVEVYLNEQLVYKVKGWTNKFIFVPIPDEVKQHLKKGKNLMAIHVENTAGGAWLDAGIVEEPKENHNANVETAQQKSVVLNATQTAYQFTCGNVDLSLTFTSPLLINDLSILSRPISYISTVVRSNDGASHNVQLYMGASSDIAANTPAQEIKATKYSSGGLSVLKAGTKAQPSTLR